MEPSGAERRCVHLGKISSRGREVCMHSHTFIHSFMGEIFRERNLVKEPPRIWLRGRGCGL